MKSCTSRKGNYILEIVPYQLISAKTIQMQPWDMPRKKMWSMTQVVVRVQTSRSLINSDILQENRAQRGLFEPRTQVQSSKSSRWCYVYSHSQDSTVHREKGKVYNLCNLALCHHDVHERYRLAGIRIRIIQPSQCDPHWDCQWVRSWVFPSTMQWQLESIYLLFVCLCFINSTPWPDKAPRSDFF